MAIDKLSFMEVAGLLGNATEKSRVKSSSAIEMVELRVAIARDFERPVDLTRLIAQAGVSLADSLKFVNELSDRGSATVTLASGTVADLSKAIEGLGLECTIAPILK